MSAISDCLWKRNREEIKKEEHLIYYGCGHYLAGGKLSLNEDEQRSLLSMIEEGLILRPKEEKCAFCLMDSLKTPIYNLIVI